MLICRTIGTAVSSVKHPQIAGYKLLIVQESTLGNKLKGDPFVAVDLVGAGEGELVLVTRGSAASPANPAGVVPIDAAIVGILDSLSSENKVVFKKE